MTEADSIEVGLRGERQMNADLIAMLKQLKESASQASANATCCKHVDNPAWFKVMDLCDDIVDDIRVALHDMGESEP